jgi:hypothetical protein
MSSNTQACLPYLTSLLLLSQQINKEPNIRNINPNLEQQQQLILQLLATYYFTLYWVPSPHTSHSQRFTSALLHRIPYANKTPWLV